MRLGEIIQGKPRHVISFDVEEHFQAMESVFTQSCKEGAVVHAGSKLWKRTIIAKWWGYEALVCGEYKIAL